MMKTILLLLLATGVLFAAEIKEFQVYSDKMNKDVPCIAVVPTDEQPADAGRPCLYLLHGAGGSCKNWPADPEMKELADRYGWLIICPDGGRTSWYFDSPVDPTYQYETFVAKELVTYVDANFPTKASREFRAIAGFSMGGHGALYLAIHHQDVFSKAGAFSGGVDFRPWPDSWDIKDRLGMQLECPDRWTANCVCTLAKDLKDGDLDLFLDCGDKDFFLKVNRELHQQLVSQKIRHVYMERLGAHTWPYVRVSLKLYFVHLETYTDKF